jgi:hypothetical protein
VDIIMFPMQVKQDLQATIEETQLALEGFRQSSQATKEAETSAKTTHAARDHGEDAVEIPAKRQDRLSESDRVASAPVSSQTALPDDGLGFHGGDRVQSREDYKADRHRQASTSEPDFAELAELYPDLRKYVRIGRSGRGSIDFTDPQAARLVPTLVIVSW